MDRKDKKSTLAKVITKIAIKAAKSTSESTASVWYTYQPKEPQNTVE